MSLVVLDTNVISEMMRGPSAHPQVVQWIDDLATAPVTTVVNRAEIMAGLAQLPPGRRRETLTHAAATLMNELAVCLPLTADSADRYGEVVATRRRLGRPIGGMDALVAAIAIEAGATVATRDSDDFAELGLDIVDPWAS